MRPRAAATTTAAVAALPLLSSAQMQSCSSTLSANYPAPSIADGYVARLVANDLTSPRGIKFDSSGALLVVEQEVGITAITFNDPDDGCVSETNRQSVVRDSTLNHGIEISADGQTLYASNAGDVYSWDYSADDHATTSEPRTLVTNMTNSDHTTRTLLLSRAAPGMLTVTRGSTSNIDVLASDISTGHSQIKAFNLTNATAGSGPYQFQRDGLLLAWGVRNEVGIAEDPATGALYGVENSVDEMTRDGVDIHNSNPAEELNFFGYLNSTQASADDNSNDNQGRNFGYPECYTAWNTSTIPAFDGEVGEQFSIGDSANDSDCTASSRQPPRLAFHPHMAPLDILFNDAGTAAWITFHGSWNSEPPVGYKLSVVEFADGEPTEPSTSLTAARDVVSNADVTRCGDVQCFRPVGLAWDQRGRLFMSSDATGEIYMVMRADGEAVSEAGSNATETIPEETGGSGAGGGGGSETGSSSTPSETGGAGFASMSALAVIFGAIAFVV